MTEKGFQDIIFIIVIIDCGALLYSDFHNTPTVGDWFILMIIEFCAQFLFNHLTKKE